MKKIRRVSYEDSLCLLFLVGSVGGCIIANLLGRELQEQLGYFDFLTAEGRLSGWGDRKYIWGVVLRQRVWQLGVGILLGMTAFGTIAYRGLALAAGFGAAVWISVCTIYGGWTGIGLFLKMVLPQGLCYIPVWCILAVGAEKGFAHMRLKAWLFMSGLFIAGTVLETIFLL